MGRRPRRPRGGVAARRSARRARRAREGARPPRRARPDRQADADGDRALTSLFLLARALGADLERAAGTGGAAVLGATALGGAFGIDGSGASPAGHGAIAGFLKSLAQEWPTVRVKAVDLAPADPADAADALLAELLADDGLVEVGYRDGTRMSVELRRGADRRRGRRAPARRATPSC